MKKTLKFDTLALLSAPREPDGVMRLAYLPPGTTVLAIRNDITSIEIDMETPDDGPDR